MQKLPQIHASRPQDPSSASLSPAAAESPRNHDRSASIDSTRSDLSRVTTVENDWNLVTLSEKVKKAPNTADIPFTLSRLDCFKGLLWLGKTRRKVAATLPCRTMGDEEEVWNGSPWILLVYALSTKKDRNSQFIPKEAQCTIDTGNNQGNIASKDFVITQLGYNEADFKPLTNSERLGGISASGDEIMPLGALHLTWYHGRSTQVFRDMRFLIISNPRCDLIIGARSIKKHDLLSPPNLAVETGRTLLNSDTDKKLIRLNAACAELENGLQTLNGDPDSDGDDDDEAKAQRVTKINATKKELKVAELEVELYRAETTMRNDPTNHNESWVSKIKKDLSDAQKELPREATPRTLQPVNTNMSSGSNTSKKSVGSLFRRNKPEKP